MKSCTALVYGWYNQGNVGDQLFIESLRDLFPDVSFVFTDNITAASLLSIDVVVLGGGSFLLDMPNIDAEALAILRHKKVCYIGVGVEATIHPIHEILMSRARFIAIRSPQQLDHVKKINPNTIVIPDLVFALQKKVSLTDQKVRSVLVVPNISVVPRWDDPHWKHAAWGYFKSEFAQFLDFLIENRYHINFVSMCANSAMDDSWASAEIISSMQNRSREYLRAEPLPTDFESVSRIFGNYEAVITQRFHGIVLSEMTKRPHLVIAHHDKLKDHYNSHGNYLSYYGVTKHDLIEQFSRTIRMNTTHILPIETNIFDELKLLFRGLQSEA